MGGTATHEGGGADDIGRVDDLLSRRPAGGSGQNIDARGDITTDPVSPVHARDSPQYTEAPGKPKNGRAAINKNLLRSYGQRSGPPLGGNPCNRE